MDFEEQVRKDGGTLPPCEGSPTSSEPTAMSWTDCFGTLTSARFGNKYVGGWKEGNPNG